MRPILPVIRDSLHVFTDSSAHRWVEVTVTAKLAHSEENSGR